MKTEVVLKFCGYKCNYSHNQFNENRSCIEISILDTTLFLVVCLMKTEVVLKFPLGFCSQQFVCLMKTEVVLKQGIKSKHNKVSEFNENRSCIEIGANAISKEADLV